MLPDPKDVEILRSGPRAWNAWRENNPSTVPDLTGIALRLSERQMGPINGGPINLKSARLQGAILRFATLSAADLEAADMSDADLVHARFDRANLSAANLSNAQLDHADCLGPLLQKSTSAARACNTQSCRRLIFKLPTCPAPILCMRGWIGQTSALQI